MDYKKFLVLFLSLMVIPIVKADGCGIVCPKNPTDAMALALLIACNLVTWTICHWVSFFIVLVTLILVYGFWWHNKGEDKKRKIKFTFFSLSSLLFIALLYPYIRAWVTTNPSTTIPDTCNTYDNDVCYIQFPEAQLNHTSIISTNYWKFYCGIDGFASIFSTDGTVTSEYQYTTAFEMFYTTITDLPQVNYQVTLLCPS